jgi:hypothetical protein
MLESTQLPASREGFSSMKLYCYKDSQNLTNKAVQLLAQRKDCKFVIRQNIRQGGCGKTVDKQINDKSQHCYVTAVTEETVTRERYCQ